MYAGNNNPNRVRAYGKVEDAIVALLRETGGATISWLVTALDRGGRLDRIVQRRNAALRRGHAGVAAGLNRRSFVKRRLEYLKGRGLVEYDGEKWRAKGAREVNHG